jgi:hypothetical protein
MALGAVSAGEIWKNQPAVKETRAVDLGDKKAVFEEYGLQAAEEADIGARKITAYRFKDVTGAYAAQLWLSGTGVNTAVRGNYLFACGSSPCLSTTSGFPGQTKGPLPILASYFPPDGQLKKTERYILGAASLAEFAPQLPADLFGLQYSPEAEVAKYRAGAGEQSLVIISYPTPQMARERAAAIGNAKIGLVRRSGPLVALVPAPSDAVAADKLMKQVNYLATVQWNEAIPVPVKAQSVAQMILAILSLAGIILVFCVLSGLAFGGIRVFRNRFGIGDASDAMIVLHLQDK